MLTFAAPAFLWALSALPVVVLLHRLRVRRQRREVAGMFLWRQARDVGSRRPRFHAGLLLLLQLAAVTALALALARPQIVTAGPRDRVIVIDASASMLATDAPRAAPAGEAASADAAGAGVRSRFDAALAAAEELAREAGRVALVRAGREPVTVLPFTNDLVRIHDALAGLRAGDAGLDAVRAATLARDLAGRPAGPAAGGAPDAAAGPAPGDAAGPGADIHWLSDTPPPTAAGMTVHLLAGGGVNVGITGFEVVAGQAWIRLSSNDPRPVEVPVELFRDERSVASTSQLVPARGDVSLTLPVGEEDGTVTVRIAPAADDALALDDVAHAGAPRLEVGLEEGFGALERALGAVPGVRTRVGAGVASLPLDLRVLTGTGAAADAALDAADGPADADAVGPGEGAVVVLPPRDAAAVAVEVLDWERADPLLRFVDLRGLVVAVPRPPPFGEEEGWTTLIRGLPSLAEEPADAPDGPVGDAGPPRPVPLLQRADRPGAPVLRFAFHPVRGDLTLRPAFPTLVVNLLDAVRGEARVALGVALPPGATRGGAPASVALQPGFYDVGGRTVHASLLAEEETRLPGVADAGAATGGATAEGRADAGAGAGAAGEGAPAPVPPALAGDATGGGTAARDLLPVLVAIAMAVLVAEWWGYSGGGRPWRRRGAGRDDGAGTPRRRRSRRRS